MLEVDMEHLLSCPPHAVLVWCSLPDVPPAQMESDDEMLVRGALRAMLANDRFADGLFTWAVTNDPQLTSLMLSEEEDNVQVWREILTAHHLAEGFEERFAKIDANLDHPEIAAHAVVALYHSGADDHETPVLQGFRSWAALAADRPGEAFALAESCLTGFPGVRTVAAMVHHALVSGGFPRD